jgi:YD repeat-containing protein
LRITLALVLLVACGSSSGGARSPGNGYCPALAGAWPWRDELFAACPIPPFAVDLPVCDGACPRPCSANGSSASGPWSATYDYDAARHWTGTTFDGPRRDRCEWVDGKLDRCTTGPGPVNRAIRDAAGRLSAIDVGFELPVRRNERGQVVAVGDRTFTYDDAGRLATVLDEARQDTTTITYDRNGRVVGTRERRFVSTWRYDRAGLLIGVDRDPHGHGDGSARHRTTLRYDAQRRLEALETSGPDGDDAFTAIYQYTCQP